MIVNYTFAWSDLVYIMYDQTKKLQLIHVVKRALMHNDRFYHDFINIANQLHFLCNDVDCATHRI